MVMRTKILYVLVSTQEDIFWEQTYVSIISLKKHNPSAIIMLLTDDATDKTLVGVRGKLLDLINEKIVIDFHGNQTNKYKSRVLKTNMRNYVQGDFLYIDSDTIILSDLSDIDNINTDIAAVFEQNRPLYAFINTRHFEENIRRFGIKHDKNDEYYNSGVMFVKDNKITHDFFDLWFKIWKEGVSHNVLFDQPSLFYVNKLKKNIFPLNGVWNCQGRYCSKYIAHSKIFHYLYDKKFSFPLMEREAFSTLKSEGIITDKINDIINNPYNYFSDRSTIVMDDELFILDSVQFAILRRMYNSSHYIFNLFNNALGYFYTKMQLFRNRFMAPPR